MKKQVIEGRIAGCKGRLCEEICCDDNSVIEWIGEYLAYHDNIKDHLISLGIKIKFKDDRVYFSGCSDGKRCKFLNFALNKDIDPRPIDCKIYPYHVDWKEMDFDNKKAHLYFADFDCPLTKKNISKEFKKNVEKVIKRDFSLLFYGMDFDVVFHDLCRYDTFKVKR